MEERFDRQLRLPDWDQNRIARSKVIVMGVGAIGNSVTQQLVLSGLGQLILCDPDRIEPSNLSRTPLFSASDVGRCKAEAAAAALRALSPTSTIEARARPLESGVGLAELREADLVLGCLDSVAARMELSSRCALAGAPWEPGTGNRGQTTVYVLQGRDHSSLTAGLLCAGIPRR